MTRHNLAGATQLDRMRSALMIETDPAEIVRLERDIARHSTEALAASERKAHAATSTEILKQRFGIPPDDEA